MNTTKKWSLALLGLSLVALLLAGAVILTPALAQGPGDMMGRGDCDGGQFGGYGFGWMMGYGQNYTGTMPFGGDIMGNCGFGFGGMMGGGMMGGGMMGGGMMGGGMMGGFSPLYTPDPLTLSEATAAVNDYLAGLNANNLEVDDVMVFDNHAYAQLVEKETGIGAMEVLVDPVTGAIYPEMGANMMWNLKYGMMAGFGGGGLMNMMGGGFGFNEMMRGDNRDMMGNQGLSEIAAEMPVTPEEAVEIAQAYLDAYVGNNLEADTHADPFYGYYTIHVERGDETIGMLSVNGYNRQVILHTWHGDLLDMSQE